MAPLHEHELFYESRPHYFPYIALSAFLIFIKIPRMCKLVSPFSVSFFLFDVVFSSFLVFGVYALPVLLRYSELKVCYLLE